MEEQARQENAPELTAAPPRSPPFPVDAAIPSDRAITSSNHYTTGFGLPVRVGNYLLTREIATGGMGTVYEAVQDQPRRIVALKLLRVGRQSPPQQRRFEFESQLLARLRHPGIAQVFEAGTHGEGEARIPFFAM